MRKSIAIIGASQDPSKYSYKAVKAYKQLGYLVFPINPHAQEIAGLKAYPDLASLSQPVEEVSFYLPPKKTGQVLQKFPDWPFKKVYLNPGSYDEKVKDQADKLGLPVIEACSIVAAGLSPQDF